MGGGWSLMLGLVVAVAVVSYGVIVGSARREARELAWTLIPALLLLALFVWTWSSQTAPAP